MTEEEKRAKHAAYMREYTKRNKEKINARRAELLAVDPVRAQKNRDRVKKWREENPERAKAFKNANYHKNKKLVGRPSGGAHHKWKEDCTYENVHFWVRRHKGSPKMCEKCGTTEHSRRYEWANVDHKYSRNLGDYIRMCTSCHREYDIKFNGTLYGRHNKKRTHREPT